MRFSLFSVWSRLGLFAGGAATGVLLAGCVTNPARLGAPPPETLQAGDLIWPKPANAVVPYLVQLHEGSTGNPTQWQTEKDRYLASLAARPTLSPLERERYNALQRMTYSDFARQYFAPLPNQDSNLRGVQIFFVGHVGIIQIENGVPFVIEAMIGFGVQKVPYKTWIGSRPRQLFWVSRLNQTTAARRAAVAAVAEHYLGKPYDFWNFNLRDDSRFYCSKLAWLAIDKATGIPPDDNPSGNRVLWYSPKQLLGSPHLESI